MKQSLPVREEINIHDSLDERTACKNFLGKDLEAAETMFQENFMRYQEDLMWMGPVAFQFYVKAATRYIQNPVSKGDSDAINCFLGLLEFRCEHEPESLRPVKTELAGGCRFVLEHYDQFEATPEIYGELCPRYERMIHRLSQL